MPSLKKNIQTFLPYIEELRERLYKVTLVFVLVFVVGFLSSAPLLGFMMRHLHIENVVIATTSPFQFADVAMDLGLFLALVVSIPLATYQFFSFIRPGLTKRERRRFFLVVPMSVSLFAIGFLYGFLVLYYSFDLLAGLNYRLGIQNVWNISDFLSQIFITASLLGLVFQFPLIITFGARLGWVSVFQLRSSRRYAYFGIVILVSLLPPTDGLSLVAMALPLVLLYEVTILLNRNIHTYVWTRN